jgi:hypothetical protein
MSKTMASRPAPHSNIENLEAATILLALATHVRARAPARASIACLPIELLDLVFSHVVNVQDEEMTPCARHHARSESFSLICVCRAWRKAGQANPRLWTRVVVDVRDLADPRSPRIPLALGRIKTHPFRLVIHASNNVGQTGGPCTPLALRGYAHVRLLAECWDRCEFLCLDVGEATTQIWSFLYAEGTTSFPMLRELHVSGPSKCRAPRFDMTRINAPRLRSIHLPYIPLGMPGQIRELEVRQEYPLLKNVRKLDITIGPDDDICILLPAIPNLESCVITRPADVSFPASRLLVHHMRHIEQGRRYSCCALRQLRIHGSRLQSAHWLLVMFRYDQLEYLELEIVDDGISSIYLTLHNFNPEPLPRLRRLRLHTSCPPQILELLMIFASGLEVLELCRIAIETHTTGPLIAYKGGNPPVSSLRRLVIEACKIDALAMRDIRQIQYERTHPPLYGKLEFSLDFVVELRQCRLTAAASNMGAILGMHGSLLSER